MTPPRPMLAASITQVSELVFPLIATPKIDGVRCLTMPNMTTSEHACAPVTRTLKPIPNIHICREIARHCPPGLDGELIGRDVSFQRTVGLIMSHHGEPEFIYHVFDHIQSFRDPRWTKGHLEKYVERQDRLAIMKLPDFCQYVVPRQLENLDELEAYEEICLRDGYEGVCLRAPHSPYKFGRSTMREHWLMKLKRFEDGEAVVIGYEELMHNKNPDAPSNLGYKVRHSYQSMMVAGEVIGALVVRDVKSGVEFKVGSGLGANQRAELWATRDTLVGRIITYKHQPHGAKDKPRTPIFKAFRGTI